MKYLRRHHNQLYYERAVPTKLKAAVGKNHVKQKLGLTVGAADSQVAAKIAQIDEQYQAWFKTVASDNSYKLSQNDKRAAALAYLNEVGIGVGELAPLSHGTLSEKEAHNEFVDHQRDNLFDAIYHVVYQRETGAEPSPKDYVIEYAWHLATEPETLQAPATFEDAWLFYSAQKKLDRGIRSQRKAIQFWERFHAAVGNQPLTSKNIYEAQREYSDIQLEREVQVQSIERSLNPILSAFRMYVDEHQLDVIVKKYKPKQQTRVQERVGITESQLRELWEILSKDNSIRSDTRLTLLLMAQSGSINSELQRLRMKDFIIEGHPEYEGVSWFRVLNGKTKDRTRPVPLVAGLELIKELLEEVADGEYVLGKLAHLTESAISEKANKVLKRVNPDLTAYSLRHGWLDRCYNVGVPESFQDRVGGWSAGSKSKKRGYARMADTGLDRLKQYEHYQKQVNRALVATSEGNLVRLNQAM
ncbi:MAG: site-specific integrase [Gammaproteobacteria bacterium]|nr:site-specific integrase [Gammaproteobacteria bacterium]